MGKRKRVCVIDGHGSGIGATLTNILKRGLWRVVGGDRPGNQHHCHGSDQCALCRTPFNSNSNLLVVDEAFEYLVNKSAKGEKGQYFTPRHVIDMCVQMLNPKCGEYMIDTASGSCGFPVHTIFKLTGHLFTNEEIPDDDKQHVLKVFGIDFDEKTVRVARTLNLIAGDGEANVLHLNSSGDYIYVKNGNGQFKLDKNGHLIVDHDLHSHDGELQDGIAEAFIEWAKSEKLSFWAED